MIKPSLHTFITIDIGIRLNLLRAFELGYPMNLKLFQNVLPTQGSYNYCDTSIFNWMTNAYTLYPQANPEGLDLMESFTINESGNEYGIKWCCHYMKA